MNQLKIWCMHSVLLDQLEESIQINLTVPHLLDSIFIDIVCFPDLVTLWGVHELWLHIFLPQFSGLLQQIKRTGHFA